MVFFRTKFVWLIDCPYKFVGKEYDFQIIGYFVKLFSQIEIFGLKSNLTYLALDVTTTIPVHCNCSDRLFLMLVVLMVSFFDVF